MAEEKKRDLFIALQVATAKGVGLRLTHEDCVILSMVTALEETAYYAFQDRGMDMTKMSLDEIAKVKP